MAAPIIQPSFAAGEISPSLYGRIDLAKWHSGVALARNFFIDYRGGASNRPGTQYVGPCLPGINRLIGFQFSVVQAYELVFSDKAMHVVMNGGLVLEPAIAPTFVFQSNNAGLLFPGTTTGYAVGDWVFITGITTPFLSTVPFNNKFWKIAAVTPLFLNTKITLADLDGNIVDFSQFGTITPPALSGTVARVYTLATPYAAADLALLKFVQSADTMTICHPNYAPQLLTRSGHANWAMTAANFANPSPRPTINTAVPSLTGDGTQYAYVVTAIAANGKTESLPSDIVSALNSKTMSQTQGANVTVTWTPVAGAQLYNVYRQPEVPGAAASSGQLFGFIGTTSSPSFVDNNIQPDFSQTPPQGFNPFAGGNNPGAPTFFEQRECFAGSNAQPQTVWMSKSADFLNMGFSSPSRADDSIVATIVAREANPIKHLVPMEELIVLTAKQAWKMSSGDSGPVTPSSLAAKPQAYNGCSDVPPVVIGQDILYVQAKGSIVRDLAYNFYAKVFTGSDLTVLANHLFSGHLITEWCWAEEPFKMIMAVRDDGALLFFTFLKEQEIYAWAHADTDGQFKSISTISEGQEDAVYVIVSRKIRGKYVQFIERFASRQLGAVPEMGVPGDFSRFFFVDCGLRNPLNYPPTTCTPQLSTSSASIYGATVTVGGAGYTNPVITVTDSGGGVGCTMVATVAGGAIVAVTVTAAGSGYVNPQVTITDPTGSGATVFPQVTRDIEMLFDAQINTVGVGDLFLVNGGYGFVRRINSSRSVTVNLVQDLASAFPAAQGTWSSTAPVTKVSGLDHLVGKTVAILADGNVLPQQVVAADGSVTLDTPASCIVVGLPYTAQLKSLYLDIPGEQPTVQGRRSTIHAVTIRQQDSRGLKVGWAGGPLASMKERAREPMGTAIPAFTGDRRTHVMSGYRVDGQVLIQQDNPLPATITALIPEVQIGDTP